VVEREFEAEAVEFAGGHSWPDIGRDKVERSRRELAGSPHSLERFLAVNLDPAVAGLAGGQAGRRISLQFGYASHCLSAVAPRFRYNARNVRSRGSRGNLAAGWAIVPPNSFAYEGGQLSAAEKAENL
jgi:hypothetical protein